MRSILTFILVTGLFYCNVSAQEILLLKSSGKVVIGDTSQILTPGDYNLYVQNGILTERVKVALKSSADWADHAFEETPKLEQVEQSIINNKHLYEMPSAASLVKNGYELKEMDAQLLKQIEWLWQHVLTLSKQNEELALKIESLQQQIKNGPSEDNKK
jgi:hypothetical protein